MSGPMDTDMTDENPSSAIVAAAAPTDPVRELLVAARRCVDQGKATEALQAVVMAMRLRGGDDAAKQILERAGELYRSRSQASKDADQLASLFAECAIAEAQPMSVNPGTIPAQSPTVSSTVTSGVSMELNTSILAESGRKQIMVDAFSDGSSFICLKCGGLVSVVRKDEHLAYWCQ